MMLKKDMKELFLAKPDTSINDDEAKTNKNDDYDSETESVNTHDAINDRSRIISTKNEKAVSYMSICMIVQACT